MQWFAQVQGQIYGPYSDSHMQTYVAEGRIAATSLISNVPADGFYPASSYDVFSFWAGTGQVSAHQAVGDNTIGGGASYHSAAPSHQPYEAPLSNISASNTPLIQPSQAVTQSYSLTPQNGAQESASEALTIFMIMAEIRSDGLMDFLSALQAFGTAERVGDAVWLLKASATADALRNSLSQALSRQDRMFIIDCTQNRTAWFNIGADLDSRIRHLWEE